MIAVALGASVSLLIVHTAALLRRDRARLWQLRRPAQDPRRVSLTAHQRNAIAVVVVVAVGLLSLPLATVIAALLLVRPFVAERRKVKRRRRAVSRELPMVAELLRLCVAGGLNVSHTLEHVGRYSRGPVGAELARVCLDVGNGARLADAITTIPIVLGDETRPIVNALVSAERYGSPLTATLERLALEARRDQERRYEQAARKLSVQLLFPVAGTVLPAFVLLTVAPLIVSSLAPLATQFRL